MHTESERARHAHERRPDDQKENQGHRMGLPLERSERAKFGCTVNTASQMPVLRHITMGQRALLALNVRLPESSLESWSVGRISEVQCGRRCQTTRYAHPGTKSRSACRSAGSGACDCRSREQVVECGVVVKGCSLNGLKGHGEIKCQVFGVRVGVRSAGQGEWPRSKRVKRYSGSDTKAPSSREDSLQSWKGKRNAQ